MKLYDILVETDDEVTVWDVDYDTECYFYGDDDNLLELSKYIDVVEVRKNGVICDICGLINKNLNNLKDLFEVDEVDDIMADWDAIISGYVSDEWMEKFVEVLEK